MRRFVRGLGLAVWHGVVPVAVFVGVFVWILNLGGAVWYGPWLVVVDDHTWNVAGLLGVIFGLAALYATVVVRYLAEER